MWESVAVKRLIEKRCACVLISLIPRLVGYLRMQPKNNGISWCFCVCCACFFPPHNSSIQKINHPDVVPVVVVLKESIVLQECGIPQFLKFIPSLPNPYITTIMFLKSDNNTHLTTLTWHVIVAITRNEVIFLFTQILSITLETAYLFKVKVREVAEAEKMWDFCRWGGYYPKAIQIRQFYTGTTKRHGRSS